MNPRFLLDTNICIYIRSERPVKVLDRFRRLKAGEAALSVITYGELLYGAAKNRQQPLVEQQLDELTSLLPVLPLPLDAARAYGNIRASLETRGMPIGGNDLWIAAHAQTAKLILVTNNEREFKRIPGLKLQNWAA